MAESANRKDKCERCGYVPTDTCQLDVDHIDGCCENNDPSNYTDLRLNCPWLKSAMHGDHLTPRGVVLQSLMGQQRDLFDLFND